MIVLVTGGFDPIHSGHLAMFKEAKKLGDELLVGINSDEWLIRKKGFRYMSWTERSEVISMMTIVDKIIPFNDKDGSSNDAIAVAKMLSGDNVTFANGGDRNKDTTMEYGNPDHDDVTFAFNVGGGDKKNSSSDIVKVKRQWGYYKNIYSGDGFKVKELVINPMSSLSMQIHKYRSETWNLVSGQCTIYLNGKEIIMSKNKPIQINKGDWHKCLNESNEPAHIIEIWKGPSDKLDENDIERLPYK